MNQEQIDNAKESLASLENFIKNLMDTIDQSIDAKIQKALQENSTNNINISQIVDERFNQNLSNFLKTAAMQLINNTTTNTEITENDLKEDLKEEIQPIEEESKEEITEEPKKKFIPLHNGSIEKAEQYQKAVDIIKSHKKIKTKDITRIMEKTHGIKWSNPTNELNRIMKRYPIKRLGYGEYKYVGEK